MSTLNAVFAAKSKACSQSHVTPIQEKTFHWDSLEKGYMQNVF